MRTHLRADAWTSEARRLILGIALISLGCVSTPPLFARNKVQNWAMQGGGTATRTLAGDTIGVQQSYPFALVTVYQTGTLSLATIYSDLAGTPLGNPLTANQDGSFIFFVDLAAVDINFSGATVPIPFTWSSYQTIVLTPTPANTLITLTNEGVTGTTAAKLAKLTGLGTAIVTTAGDTTGVIGIVTAGAGTTGTATVAISGNTACVFDGATTANDYVGISASVNGDCTDIGAVLPTTGTADVLGRVLSTHGSGGSYTLTQFGPEHRSFANRSTSNTFSSVNAFTTQIVAGGTSPAGGTPALTVGPGGVTPAVGEIFINASSTGEPILVFGQNQSNVDELFKAVGPFIPGDHVGDFDICTQQQINFSTDFAVTLTASLTNAALYLNGGVQLKGGSAPTCNAGNRGLFWYVPGGAGVKDVVEVCAKDAADAYAFRAIY